MNDAQHAGAVANFVLAYRVFHATMR